MRRLAIAFPALQLPDSSSSSQPSPSASMPTRRLERHVSVASSGGSGEHKNDCDRVAGDLTSSALVATVSAPRCLAGRPSTRQQPECLVEALDAATRRLDAPYAVVQDGSST